MDFILSATGVLPNCEWTKTDPENCGLKQDEEKGIFVDATMHTSSPDIFAAGDVCYPNWKWSKHWFQV